MCQSLCDPLTPAVVCFAGGALARQFTRQQGFGSLDSTPPVPFYFVDFQQMPAAGLALPGKVPDEFQQQFFSPIQQTSTDVVPRQFQLRLGDVPCGQTGARK